MMMMSFFLTFLSRAHSCASAAAGGMNWQPAEELDIEARRAFLDLVSGRSHSLGPDHLRHDTDPTLLQQRDGGCRCTRWASRSTRRS